jgi:CRP/FNR family transcriptional regulator, cyclic AMP receptor protein
MNPNFRNLFMKNLTRERVVPTLSTLYGGRKIEAFSKKQTIFAQGDPSDAVFYVKEGKVRPTVVSDAGKEATIGILNEGAFFGEGCLTGQRLRLCSATAMTDCSVMRIEKKSMIDVLHREHAFSDMFVAHLLTRNIRYEEDLVDQLFNSSEKRLARILLLLAQFGKEGEGKHEVAVPNLSQETLAEMECLGVEFNLFLVLGRCRCHGSLLFKSSECAQGNFPLIKEGMNTVRDGARTTSTLRA